MSNVKFQYLFQLDDKGSIKQVGNRFMHLEKRLKGLALVQDKLKRALDKTSRAMDKQRNHTRNLHGTFSVLRSKMLLAAFGVSLYAKSLGAAVKASNRQKDAETKLSQAIASTGRASQFSAIQLKNYASHLQSLTTFGDEAIIESQALLLTFTKIGKDVFPEATKAILDVSAATGSDLLQETIRLGKALNDPIQGVAALRRVGIDLTKEQKIQVKQFIALNKVAEAQGVILEELKTQFGGMAEALSQTASGAIQQMKNAWGDLFEVVGRKASPFFVWLAKELEKSADNLRDPADAYIKSLTKMGASEQFVKTEQEKISRSRINALLKESGVLKTTVDENTNLQLVMQELTAEIGNNEFHLQDLSKAYEKAMAAGVKEKGSVEELMRAYQNFTPVQNVMSAYAGKAYDETIANIMAKEKQIGATQEEQQSLIAVQAALRDYMTLVGENTNAVNVGEQYIVQFGKTLSDSFALMFAPDMKGGDKIKEFIIKIISLFQGVILASKGVNSSLKKMFDPITGGAQIIGALLLLEASKAAVRKVKFAAKGMNEIVNEPTMIIAGEAGAERVNITPLSGGSSSGQSSGGGGVTVNISGGIVQDDYVRNQLIPALNKATGTGTKINA